MDWTELIILLGSAGAVSYERWAKESPRSQNKKLREGYQRHAICSEYHKEWGIYILKVAQSYYDSHMLNLGLDAIKQAKKQAPHDDRVAQAYEIVADCERFRLSGPIGRSKLREKLQEHAQRILEQHPDLDGMEKRKDKSLALFAHAVGYIHQLLGTRHDKQEANKWYERAEVLGYSSYVGPAERKHFAARKAEVIADSTLLIGLKQDVQRLGSRLRYVPSLRGAILSVFVAGGITLFPLAVGSGPVFQPLYLIHFVPPLAILLVMDVFLALALSYWFGTMNP
jgi:hypothetical protein